MPATRSAARQRPSPYDRIARSAPTSSIRALPLRRYTKPLDAADIQARTAAKGYSGLNPAIVLAQTADPFLGAPPNNHEIPLPRNLDDELTLAKNTSILDPKSHDEYNNASLPASRSAYVIYVCQHRVTATDMVQYVFPSKTPEGSARKELQTAIDKQLMSVQRQAGQFFLNGVKRTREVYNGDEMDLGDVDVRTEIWSALFNRAPQAMTAMMLGVTANHVDLENIFDHPNRTEEREMWAYAFKTIFMTYCNAICDHCPGDMDQVGNPQMRLWYKDWREGLRNPLFVQAFPAFKFQNLPVNANINKTGRRNDNLTCRDMSNEMPKLEDDSDI